MKAATDTRTVRVLCDMFTALQWRLLFASLIVLLMTDAARGQNNSTNSNQLWFDYSPNRLLSKQWTLDLTNGTRFVSSDPSYWQLRLLPTLEFSRWKSMDWTGGVWLIYTNQFDASKLFETRPNLGLRLKHDVWRGIRLSNYFRAEYRFQSDLSESETMAASRLRNMIQAMIPINRRTLSADNTWYGIIDDEWFWQSNENVDLGFLSRQRFRTGIAWRKNSAAAFELLYVYQRSINSDIGSFSTLDHILSLRVIHTFD